MKSTSSQPKNKRGQLQTEYCVAIGWHKLARPPLIGRHRVSRPVIGPQSAEGVHFSATRQRGHLQSERDSAAVRTPSSSPGPGSGSARLPSSSTPAMASRIVKSPHVQVSGNFWRFWWLELSKQLCISWHDLCDIHFDHLLPKVYFLLSFHPCNTVGLC